MLIIYVPPLMVAALRVMLVVVSVWLIDAQRHLDADGGRRQRRSGGQTTEQELYQPAAMGAELLDVVTPHLVPVQMERTSFDPQYI